MLAAGILASRLIEFRTNEANFAACWIAFLCLFAWRRGHILAARLAGAVLFLFAGIWAERTHRPDTNLKMEINPEEVVTVEGCVVEPPSFSEGRERLVVELGEGARVRLTLNAREGEQLPKLHYGDRIETGAKLRKPHNFGNPGAFDIEGYLAKQSIFWTGSTPTGEPVKVTGNGCGHRVYSWLYILREAALDRIESLYPGDEYASAMMQAILLGETGKLQQVWTDNYRRTGTYHAIVISGLHITVLTFVLLELLRGLMVKAYWRLLVTLLIAWVYALVSGATAPVIRAAGGFTIFIIAGMVYRRARVLNCLAAVAIPFLVVDPQQLFEASFQLSFLCVAAIALFGVPLLEATSGRFSFGLRNLTDPNIDLRLPPEVASFRLELRLLAETCAIWTGRSVRFWLRVEWVFLKLLVTAWETAAITFAIQLALALPMVTYFHRISLTGLTANILVAPALTFTVPIGFLAIFTGWHWVAAIARLLLTFSDLVSKWHVQFEPNYRVPAPPLWLALGCVASLGLFAVFIRKSSVLRYPMGAIAIACLVLLIAHPFAPQINPHQLEMTTIDVGQGDSVLLVLPDGHTILVDAGGFPQFGKRPKPRMDIGEDVVSSYLWNRSIRKLDVVVLTHAHEDHSGGMEAVLENFRPTELWVGAMPEDAPAWIRIRDKAAALHIPVIFKHAGQDKQWGDTQFRFISPMVDYVTAATVKNNDSLAFEVRYGSRSFLLTGDMEKQAEARLAIEGAINEVDVLKVAHHGSRTSSTTHFLDQAAPILALISAGLDNRFHHPNKDVVARLENLGATTLRTDQLGLVSVFTDGKRLTVESFHWQATRAPLFPVFGD